jgi:hypothetical protein
MAMGLESPLHQQGSIDLAWLRRRGILRTGNRATLTWSRAGEQTGSIGVFVLADGLRLMYAVTAHDGIKSASTSSCRPYTRPPSSAVDVNG